ncbi:hypothetical protein [Paractinoplanes brasiliensis]|uniref:Fibronectin type-III domain-containing protein n=1 Tax=Paractinoplanes brasiliensis TaxID=52695 RepID=A0A4R6JLG8_9ACTN|nr:hypothetical protein [Actinoplanes brasiliensis]TDO36542.1 hypothetical protein C8E87_0118 [Actinoplanes brasiliensis]GID32491.1 hypothetical protein Abr02nite_74740 [Actinoplanes brasiliensis]
MIVNLAAVLALTPAAAGLPAAFAPAVAAPTDVRVAWTSTEHTDVEITWDESVPARNRLTLVPLRDGPVMNVEPKIVEADRPDRALLWQGLYDNDYRVRVVAIDADGAEISEPAFSPVFDTDRDPAPRIVGVAPREDGSILMTWRPGTLTDRNPGDPLDTTGPFRYIPVASLFEFNEYEDLAPPTTATSFVVPPRQAPVNVGLRTTPNGWYGYTGANRSVQGNRLTVTIPRRATIGGTVTVTGKAVKLNRLCDPGPCPTYEEDDAGRELRLQERTGATAEWRTVATTKARKDGTYALATPFAGTRDYRVVAPAVSLAPGRTAQVFAATAVTTTTGVTGPADGDDNGGSGGGLPVTGAPVVALAVGGGLLVAAGAALALTGRRRRRPSSGE